MLSLKKQAEYKTTNHGHRADNGAQFRTFMVHDDGISIQGVPKRMETVSLLPQIKHSSELYSIKGICALLLGNFLSVRLKIGESVLLQSRDHKTKYLFHMFSFMKNQRDVNLSVT